MLTQDPAMASLGDGRMDGHIAHDGRLESPYRKSQASELACHGSSEQDGIRGANSHDSDALIHMVRPWQLPVRPCRIKQRFRFH